MKYIFILSAFKILDIDIFLYIVAQTLKSLTLTKTIGILIWKEVSTISIPVYQDINFL
jgi:hypothetical protein